MFPEEGSGLHESPGEEPANSTGASRWEGEMKRGGLMVAVFGVFVFVQGAQAGWTPVKRLTWGSVSSQNPAIAVDSFNTIHIVWQEYSELYYKRSTDGGTTWSAAKRLTWTSGFSWYPAISIDSANGIHVVWQDYTPGSFAIYYLTSSDRGLTWSAAKRLTWNTGSSEYPDIADLYNEVHIVWDTPAAGGMTDIYYKRSTTSGYTWTAAKRLTWTPGFSESALIAIDSSDVVHVVWTDYTPGTWTIYYRKSPDGGATWSPVRALTWGSYAAVTAISVGPNDFVHIVWVGYKNDNDEIFYRRSIDKGATWNTAKRLTQTSGESQDPDIALAPNGGIHVVWNEDTPGNKEIYYKKSMDGGDSWSTVLRLTFSAGSSQCPALAADFNNGIHVVWEDDTPGNEEIYYRSYK
jgi:BNR repeat-like domain